jgi:pimeloyl-ACP methyl ester carboxylesterase
MEPSYDWPPVVAPDQRGYGGTDRPFDVTANDIVNMGVGKLLQGRHWAAVQ